MKNNFFKFGFFLGSDISSHIILNICLPILMGQGHEVYVFVVPQKINSNAPRELQELFLYERTILNDVIYPFLDTSGKIPKTSKLYSFKQLSIKYGRKLHVKVVENINDEQFLGFLVKERVSAACSLRCYQKFSREIIEYFGFISKNLHQPFLANLHPGDLPRYRGVLTYSRAMQNREERAGFTLHLIDTDWDAGQIIGKSSSNLDYSLSVIENMCAHSETAAQLLIEALNKLCNGVNIRVQRQDPDLVSYYSHASEQDLLDFEQKNIRLIRPRVFTKKILEDYLSLDEQDYKLLTQLIHTYA